MFQCQPVKFLFVPTWLATELGQTLHDPEMTVDKLINTGSEYVSNLDAELLAPAQAIFFSYIYRERQLLELCRIMNSEAHVKMFGTVYPMSPEHLSKSDTYIPHYKDMCKTLFARTVSLPTEPAALDEFIHNHMGSMQLRTLVNGDVLVYPGGPVRDDSHLLEEMLRTLGTRYSDPMELTATPLYAAFINACVHPH